MSIYEIMALVSMVAVIATGIQFVIARYRRMREICIFNASKYLEQHYTCVAITSPDDAAISYGINYVRLEIDAINTAINNTVPVTFWFYGDSLEVCEIDDWWIIHQKVCTGL